MGTPIYLFISGESSILLWKVKKQNKQINKQKQAMEKEEQKGEESRGVSLFTPFLQFNCEPLGGTELINWRVGHSESRFPAIPLGEN